MSVIDQLFALGEESAYGVAVATGRAFEFNSEGIEETEGRTQGDPLRVGTQVMRADRFTPYFSGAAGTVQFDVMTKGFGVLFKHALGQVATVGPTDGGNVYTHTATMADLLGRSLTVQVGRPLHPSGVTQPFTYRGGKVTDWTLSNSVDGNLVLDLGLDFQQVDTTTALASNAAYPAGMDNFAWAGGVVSVGGVNADVTEISIKGDNALNTDRRYIRGNTDKKEPVVGRRGLEFSLSADFDSLTARNRAHANTRAGALATIAATWVGPTILGTTLFPAITVTLPAARFDSWKGENAGPEAISQDLSGVGLFDGVNSAVSVAYRTADPLP